MIRLTVHAHPGSSRESLDLKPDGTLDARVRAPAVDGRANAALVRLLADRLGLRPRQVVLVRGQAARTKLVELDVASVDAVRLALGHDG